MAAGGPKSADLAARYAQGIITSVKDPTETEERVVGPARDAAASAGTPVPRLLATRWAIKASTAAEAWEALRSWRGLRAPGRLQAVDPRTLRERADELPRDEVLGRYSIADDPAALAEIYAPLVTELGADIVALQVAAVDQEATIRMLGEDVLPRLRG